MAKVTFRKDDKVKIVQPERTKMTADGSTKPLSNHNGKKGVVIKVLHKQHYRKDKADEGTTQQVVSVRLDGEDQARGFPESELEKV